MVESRISYSRIMESLMTKNLNLMGKKKSWFKDIVESDSGPSGM